MKITSVIKKLQEKGFQGTLDYCKEKIPEIIGDCVHILLLTNRDSDNVGDQVIEACDISLLSAVMQNLNKNYRIHSHAASIVSTKYLQTKDEKLLATADALIQKADVVVFGGAPMFNFLYQSFYERTAVTLEIAQKYKKPVLFSAIGIEGYGETNKKCQRLKKTLNFDCVKQITTRDDLESLLKYKENPQMAVDKVADPAVFSDKIFEKFKVKKDAGSKKKIGIFILRQNGFVDNKIPFTKEQSAALWLDLMRVLDKKGYKYELLTSGHFGDEAFLDYLIRKYNVNANKCVFNMDSPEKLVKKISSCDAIVSCRLHPSIIAFSLGVPSLGVVWNPKVKGFYQSIGCPERAYETNGISGEMIADKLEQMMAEGVCKEEAFLMSVYHTLFYGIGRALGMDENGLAPYSYAELLERLPAYTGVSAKEQKEKLERKFRRTYKTCNDRFDKNEALKRKVADLEAEVKRLKERDGDR